MKFSVAPTADRATSVEVPMTEARIVVYGSGHARNRNRTAHRIAHSRRVPYRSATMPAAKNGRPIMSIRWSQKSAE